jgi:hypothetical protein
MTILQGATFVGLDHNDVRPRADLEKADVEQLLKDGACVYEETFGIKVPGSTTIAATPHDHMAAGQGAPIRIPLAHWRPNALLRERAAGWSGTPGWYPFQGAPFPVPTGISKVQVIYIINKEFTARSLTATTYDESLTEVQERPPFNVVPADHWLGPNYEDRIAAVSEMDVTPGEFNVLECLAWDGLGTPDEAGPDISINDRWVYEVLVVPVERAPHPVEERWEPTLTSSDDFLVPSDHISIDDHMVQDDRSFNSHVAGAILKNTNLAIEGVTGQPAGNRASVTVAGHNHKDDAATSLADGGADFDQGLLSCCYGVVRPNEGSAPSADYGTSDSPDSESTWFGLISAPTVNNTSTAEEVIARHRFRMPAATDANAGISGSSPKLKVAIYVWTDQAAVNCTMRARIGNEAASSWSSQVGDTASGADSKTLLVIDIKAQATEAIQTLELSAQMASYKQAACTLLGSALGYFA